LRAAARKYNVPVDELPRLASAYAEDLLAIDAGEARLGELEAAARAAQQAYVEAASALSARRREAAAALEAAVAAELPALRLERARFTVALSSDRENGGPAGIDTVEFWVRTNPGTRPGPIMKVASGG